MVNIYLLKRYSMFELTMCNNSSNPQRIIHQLYIYLIYLILNFSAYFVFVHTKAFENLWRFSPNCVRPYFSENI